MPEISEEELTRLKDAEERAKALEAKSLRLEDESKKYKSRAQQAEEKISEAEKAKLEEQGELEKLLAKEREEKAQLTNTLEKRTQGVIREKLRSTLATHAKDAHDVDMLLKVTEHKDLLSIDEENFNVSGVEEFVAKAKETHSYLFKKNKIDGMGEGGAPAGGGKEQKSDEELYKEELRACNSRKELDAVKKKYGRL